MISNEKFNLKLVGQNQEDLKVISAYLQDSVVVIKDIVFLKKNRTFVMMVNRFMWEDVERGVFRESKRIRCAVKFDEVISVMSKNINQKNENKPLECLAIESSLITEEKYKINVFFAGGGLITIILEVIQVIMYDIGEPWFVKYVPKHKI